MGRSDIHAGVLLIKSAVDLMKVLGIMKARIIGLDLKCEARVIGEQHGDLRLILRAKDNVPDLLDLCSHALDLLIAAAWGRIVIEQAVPILLRAIARCAPTKKDNRVGAMGNGLVRPKPEFAGTWCDTDDFPAALPGLLFHYPDILGFQAAHCIQAECHRTG